MEELKENSGKRETEKRIKQEITVPFVWEERPGAPKKDWKPMSKSISPVALPLIKYVASVPFKWEEKPGTPLQCFASDPKDQPQVPEPVLENRCLPLPPAFFANIEYYDSDDDDEGEDNEDSLDDDDYDDDVDPDWTSIWGSEAQTEESFSTTVIPLQNPFVDGSHVDHTPMGSPESGRSPSNNYATGNNATSLRGATFLEYLFPMIPPKSEEKLPVPKREPLGFDENSKKLGGDFLVLASLYIFLMYA